MGGGGEGEKKRKENPLVNLTNTRLILYTKMQKIGLIILMQKTAITVACKPID